MPKLQITQIGVQLNQDEKIAQVVMNGTLVLTKSQAGMGFQWNLSDEDKVSLQGLVDKAIAQIKKEEGL